MKLQIDIVNDTMSEMGMMDAQMGNIISNGGNLRGDLSSYRKGESDELKAWFKKAKPIVVENIKIAKRARKSFDKLLADRRELESNGKLTSFSRRFRRTMEDFEDMQAACNAWQKHHKKLLEILGWTGDDYVNRKLVRRGWPYVLSFHNYHESFRDRYKKTARRMRTVAAMRT